MSQIAAALAPTVLPSVAGAFVQADAATAQGANFAELLAQFRGALLTQLVDGRAAPDAAATTALQTVAATGGQTLQPDVVQGTPPATPLNPLDILALPPSKPRTDPDAISEGGAAILPPNLALLEFVFPAAQARPLPESAAAAPKLDIVDVAALGLRAPSLPEQSVATVDAPIAHPATQTAQPAQVTPPATSAQPESAVPQTKPTPAAPYKASDTALEHAAGRSAVFPPDAANFDLRGLRGSLLPEQAAPAVDTPPAQPQPQAAQLTPPPSTQSTAPAVHEHPAPATTNYNTSDTAAELAAPVALLTAVPNLKPANAPQAPNSAKLAAQTNRSDRAPADATVQPQALTPNTNATFEATPAPEFKADPSRAASAAPVNKDGPAANASAQPLAVAPAPVLPTLIDAQAVNTVATAAPQAGVPLDALAVHIARKVQEGSSQFELRLHPMELGRLDISLTVAEDGRVQAVLRAERPETLDMLQRDARVLEQQLRQAGLEVGSNALSFSLSSGNGQRQSPFMGWPAFADAQNVAGAAKEEAASIYTAVRARDGVDIRV